MTKSSPFCLLCIALSVGVPAGAAPLPNSLAATLSTTSSAGPVIALGVDSVQPSDMAVPPPAGESPDNVVGAYGYTTHVFGTVTAVGPATIAVAGDPSTVDPVQSMSDGRRLMLFAALLDQDQWDMLRGPNGIGLSDLSSDAQAALFRSFFRPGTMKASVNYMPNEAVPIDQELRGAAETVKDPVLTDDDVNGAHLRLGVRPEILMPLAQATVPPPGSVQAAGVNYVDARVGDDPSSSANYLLAHTAPNATAPPTVRPNAPDAGDLDLSGDWAKMPMTPRPGEGLGDLLQTIHSAGGPEIYANPQFEHRDLTVAGTVTPSTAGDVLRAIAFAAAGTYRKVGDMYALTFDKTGSAVDWAKLADAAAAVEEKRRETIGQEEANAPFRSEADLTGAFSPLVLSADEMSGMQGDTLDTPYASMTPAQQDYVQRSAAKMRVFLGSNALDAKTDIRIVLRPYLQAIVPSLDGPAELETEGARLADLFPSSTPSQVPAASTTLAAFKRRAVIVRAKSNAQIDGVVDAMAGLGLTELWVDGDKDVLTHAVDAGRRHGIKVRDYLDVLDWPDAPTDARDCPLAPNNGGTGEVYVSPTTATAKTHAAVVVDGVQAVGGIDGVVFGSTTPPGYGEPSSTSPPAAVFEQELGYTVASREAFLRLTHADPIDILPSSRRASDDALTAGRDPGVDSALTVEWSRYRADAASSLLKSLEVEAARKLPNVPVLVQLRDGATGDASFAEPSTPAGASILDVPFEAVSSPSRLQEFVDASGSGAYAGGALDLRRADDPAAVLSRLAGGAGGGGSAKAERRRMFIQGYEHGTRHPELISARNGPASPCISEPKHGTFPQDAPIAVAVGVSADEVPGTSIGVSLIAGG